MSAKHLSAALVAVLAIGAWGCKSDSPQPTQTAAPLKPAGSDIATSAKELQTPTVHAHMAEHYAQADSMKRSVIRGDLAGYREAAGWLSEHEISPTAPETWRAHASAMQQAAKAGRDAQDLARAAAALGRVGEACAACHTDLGRPSLQLSEPPAEGSGAQLHMARHQWAADRLWDGLIVPSEPIWFKAAEVMADAPLAPAEVAPGQSVSPQVRELASNVHNQANIARSLPQAERGAAYAEFVSSCSECHQALNITLK